MKNRTVVFLIFGTVVVSTLHSLGATNTWISGSGFWTAKNQWLEGAEPTPADDVFFDSLANGVGGWVRLNGGPAGLEFRSVRSLTFLPGVGSYLLDGNTGGEKKEVLIGEGGILNSSTELQAINAQVFVSASQVWDASGGNIVAEDIVQLGTNTLTVTGSSNITINGVVSGSGNLVKDGPGTLTFSATNDYTGSTILNSGTLAYLAGQNLSGSLVLNGGVLDAKDNSLAFGSLVVGGDSTLQLGTDTTSQLISFTDSVWSGGTLTIENWNFGAGSDQVQVLNQPSQDLLNHVTFDGFAPGAVWSGTLLQPIPEPSAALLAGLGATVFFAARILRAPLLRSS